MRNPTTTAAWQELQAHSRTFLDADFSLHDLVAADPDRATGFSLEVGNLLLDYSRNYLTTQTRDLLLQLAGECELEAAIAAMFAGEAINTTEARPALHVALREPGTSGAHPEVAQTLDRMETFVAAVRGGDWQGFSGKVITDVVNIGIGGSDLGPAMVTEALGQFHTGAVNCHFVSNVDPAHIETVLAPLDAQTTLFIIASKSFTTLETHQNAQAARRWFLDQGGDEATIARHFIAISSNLEAVQEFGMDAANIFPLWDWVGGRYSLWSAIGMPVALAIGMPGFRRLLAGAHAMDEHFRTAAPRENMPVLLGLLGVWYSGFMDSHSTAVVPYSQRLTQFPAFLQQLCMESLGKSVDRDSNPVAVDTGEVIWGTAGTNGQHSYFQLLHQGTRMIPVDFIATATPSAGGSAEQHEHLLANCFSQALALMNGDRSSDDPHRHIAGNKPSNTLLMAELNPENLGALIALYEHKVFVQSAIWNINAFDQWGVELGKRLSHEVYATLTGQNASSGDASVDALIQRVRRWQA